MRIVLATALAVLPFAAQAQIGPGVPVPAAPAAAAGPSAVVGLEQDWLALQAQIRHVQDDLLAFAKEDETARKASAAADGKLKWVLDNWVGTPPAKTK